MPCQRTGAIFAAAREPKALLELRGTHNDAFLRDERNYVAGLRAFLDGL